MNQEDILKDLNKEQKEAVTFDKGPLLIIAGAGTGKTTVITRRIARLILNNLAKPEEILAITFTEKAAEEMETRVDQILPYGYLDMWISTFHAFCERVLKDNALEIGLSNDFKLINQTEQGLIIRENLDRFNLDYYRPLGNPNKFIQAIVKHFSRAKDEFISPEDYLNYVKNKKLDLDNKQSDELLNEEVKRWEEIANAYHVYQQILLENNMMDFGDLINYTVKLFETRPLILEKYRQQFKYVLVDEFQDTNYVQYKLIKLISSPKNNLTVVSDDDQAIFLWRGASYNNVIQFQKDYLKSKKVALAQNYRSHQNILDLAYKFIQFNNPDRLEAQIKDLTKKLTSQKNGPGEILHFHTKNQEEEVRKVIEKILELKKSGEKKTDIKPIKEKMPEEISANSSISWNDFAILVRANDQAEIFCQALNRLEIPYQFMASRGLYGKSVILDILSYLRLLDNYHESSALYRILSSPILKLEHQEISELNYFAGRKNYSLYETLKRVPALKILSPESLKEINKLLGWIEKHTQLAKEKTISQLIFAFLEDTGYLKIISQKKDLESFNNLSYLNQFFKKAEEYERTDKERGLKNFRENLDLAIEMGDEGSLEKDSADTGPESVKIMTIHGAKGLEFRYVFIVNLVDRRFPTTERKEIIELPDDLVKEIIPQGDIHLQEERRLFYVAMTRAKEGLYFTSAEDYGGVRKKKISRFLQELGFGEEATGTSKKAEKETAHQMLINKFSQPQFEISKGKIWSLPKKFSFTQIRAFETCPLQYKFAHILHVPVKGRFNFSFGKSIHQTLLKFFREYIVSQNKTGIQQSLIPSATKVMEGKSSAPALDKLLEIYESSWIDDWYNDKKHQEEYKAKGKTILKQFYQKFKEEMPNPRFLELVFNFKLGDFIIKGAMDRVDQKSDKTLEIIDYKTGSVPKEELSLKDKEQLLIYQLAGEDLFREKISKLTFYYLEENKEVSFLGGEADLEKIKDKVMAVVEEIKKSDFLPTPSSFKCKFCDFKDICEFREN